MRGFKDLKVFQLAYKLSMQIYEQSKKFPREERYSMTDQIRRASRSVSTNIAEGYRKRQYPNAFRSKTADSDGEVGETQVWVDYARDCGYWPPALTEKLSSGYDEVGRMLGAMIAHPEKFTPT